MKTKVLLFFSTGYPYETPLNYEFERLSTEYKTIYYFPSSIGSGEPPVPLNLIIRKDIAYLFENFRSGLIVKHLFSFFSLFFSHLFQKENFGSYVQHWRFYAKNLLVELEKVAVIEKFIKDNDIKNFDCYDYWFENSTMALAILKSKGVIEYAICRTHRFDLYDDEENGLKVPFREFKLKYLDKIIPSSQFGRNYLTSKTKSYQNKIHLSYCGIRMHDFLNPKNPTNTKIIVSCSNFREFKRVHYIPKVLSLLNGEIKWIHFGTGEFFEEAKKLAEGMPKNISFEFKGNVPNEQVLDFYKNNPVDLFLSLSVSEGLPFSMMEAISYGIPVAAVAALGIPELVNENTGFLFEKEDSLEVLASKLKEGMFKKKYDKEFIKNEASHKYDVEKNVDEFIFKFLK